MKHNMAYTANLIVGGGLITIGSLVPLGWYSSLKTQFFTINYPLTLLELHQNLKEV